MLNFKISSNLKNIIIVLIISTFSVLFFNINEEFYQASSDIKINDIGITYNTDKLISTSSNQNEVKDADNIFDELVDQQSTGVLNTDYTTSKSLVSFSETKVSQGEYLTNNSQYLEDGYTVTIGDEKLYIDDLSYIDYVRDLAVHTFLPTSQAISIYDSTGEIPMFTYNGRLYTSVELEDPITVEESYVMSSKIIKSKEEFLFYIMHGDVEPIYDEMTEDVSLDDIQLNNKISSANFEINNPGLTSDTLFYNGQQFVVNKLDPIVKVNYYYEVVKDEVVNYSSETIYSDEIDEGVESVTRKGKVGSQEVTYRTKITNGVEQYTAPVEYNIVTRPVNEQITVGTKVIPGVGDGTWLWPSSGGSVICGYGCYSGHKGTDIQAWYGAPIYAADNGVVSSSSYSSTQGNFVMIDHGNGYVTHYYHMSNTAVSAGQTVEKGQVIGYEGETGTVTAEHLHFEILQGGAKLDPMTFY